VIVAFRSAKVALCIYYALRYFRGAKGDYLRYFRGAKGNYLRYFRGAKGDYLRYFRGAKGNYLRYFRGAKGDYHYTRDEASALLELEFIECINQMIEVIFRASILFEMAFGDSHFETDGSASGKQ
jgi:hypothetical protein